MSGRPQRPTASHRVFPSLILVSYQFKDGTWEKGIQMATQVLDQFEIESPNDLFFFPAPHERLAGQQLLPWLEKRSPCSRQTRPMETA
jgi:hypothetical protein